MTIHWVEMPHLDHGRKTHHARLPTKLVTVLPCQVREADNTGEPLPCLLLRGSWLRDIGFAAGGKVMIAASEGLISIMLEQPARPIQPGKSLRPLRRHATVVDMRLEQLRQRRQEQQA